MAHDDRPCIDLPRRHLSVFLTYCETHQAWTLTHHAYHEDGESITDVAPYTVTNFGPFDGLADVESAVTAAVHAGALRLLNDGSGTVSACP